MNVKISIVMKSFEAPKLGFFSWHSIRLPRRRSLYTVLRSPHIDKKSREQFELKTHKQLVIIKTDISQLREKLCYLKFHEISGVQMKVTFHYKTRFAF
uniref:Ribosomal protein S10 n=1 Tax=Gonatozygon brebissonii TaxID=184482 RepID=A0A6G9IGB2_9VIRI|nr:ribosomal protein S10 [Gonatozygon brebissonii]QIQ23073.1 ribosomal protein S10 [Gonatozygon brebissonii]